jgi:acyl homoserine lactone synthase
MIRITRGYDLACQADCAMFEDRRRLFVDLLAWNVPVIADRFELDQYDGPLATYIAEVNESCGHEGSLRLLPTDSPHILCDLFPQLVDGPVPVGPDVCEITRLCLPSRLPAARRLKVRNRLITAMVDHALQTGISTLTGVTRPAFRDAVLEMGWLGRALGRTQVIDGMALSAFAISIDPKTPERLAATGVYVPTTKPLAAPALSVAA